MEAAESGFSDNQCHNEGTTLWVKKEIQEYLFNFTSLPFLLNNFWNLLT